MNDLADLEDLEDESEKRKVKSEKWSLSGAEEPKGRLNNDSSIPLTNPT